MNIKRFLSFITIFVFTLVSVIGCFPGTGAYASTIVLGDGDYINSQNVIKTICPEFPLTDSAETTRAEFVAAVGMALNFSGANVTETGFTDVSEKHPYASYITYAASMNLINNVALFYPDSPVTYAQAIKIVMSAAGYGKKAEFTGGFPAGYLKAANEAGVGRGTQLGNDDPISHEIATRLIFEACTIDMLEATSFGSSYEYTLTEGKNIFSVYHGIYMAEGVVEANGNTGLYSGTAAAAPGSVEVDGNAYYGSGYDETIGKKVRVFYRDDTKNTIVTAYELSNAEYMYTSNDAVTVSGLTITASRDDELKDTRYALEDDYNIIYNGKHLAVANVNPYFNIESGTITLVDNDENKKIDAVLIRDIEYCIVGSINTFDEKIYDKYKKSGLINLGLDDVNYIVKDSDGNIISLDDIESGDKLGYVVSVDSKYYEIIKYTHRIGGTYEMATSEDNIVLKGTEYKLSSYYSDNVKAIENIKLGTEIILHLGFEGQVIYVEEFETSVHYAFMVAAGREQGLNSVPMIKMYTDEGKMVEATLASKVKIDGTSYTAGDEVMDILDSVEAKSYAYRVFKYTQNAEGKINKIFTATDNTAGTNMVYTQNVSESRPVIYYNSTEVAGAIPEEGEIPYVVERTKCPFHSRGAFTPYFHAGSGTKMMQIPVRPSQFAEDDNFRIISSVEDNYHRAVAYDVSHGGIAPFIIISSDSSAGSIGKYDSSAIIESISQGVNEDGEVVTILKLFYGGNWGKYYYEPEFTKITAEKTGGDGTQVQTELTINDFGPGDIIRISADSSNLIGEMTMNFDFSERKVVSTMVQTGTNNGRYVEYIQGYALSYSANRLLLATDKTLDEIDAVNGNVDIEDTYSGSLTRGTTVFVRMHRDRQSGAVESAEVYKEETSDGIETFFNSGRDADYVVLRQYFRDPSLNVIYVNIDG